MAPVRRLVVDVLKPHDPSLVAFTEQVSETDSVAAVTSFAHRTRPGGPERETHLRGQIDRCRRRRSGRRGAGRHHPLRRPGRLRRVRRQDHPTLQDPDTRGLTALRSSVGCSVTRDVRSISRRYFVSNGFDGTLTCIGVVVGAVLPGIPDGVTVVKIGLGAAVGLGTSAVWSASGRSNAPRRAREILRLERAMLTDLDDTRVQRDQQEPDSSTPR